MKYSVIIPLYNGAKTIEKTLDSILAQTYKDYEIILVNDGSPDNIGSVVKDYIAKHSGPQYAYIEQQNKGLGGARNTAIKNATGEIIAILDQDDIWYPEKLEKVSRIYDRFKDVEVVRHNCLVRKNGKIIGSDVGGHSEKDMHRAMLFKGNMLTTLTTVFKKSLIDRVGFFSEDRENLHLVEDYDLWLRMAYAGCRFYFMSDYLAEYIQHGDNFSLSSLDRMCKSELFVLDMHYKLLKNRTFFDGYLLRRRKAETCFLPARRYLLSGNDIVKGAYFLWLAFSADPLFGITIVTKIFSRLKNNILFWAKKGAIK